MDFLGIGFVGSGFSGVGVIGVLGSIFFSIFGVGVACFVSFGFGIGVGGILVSGFSGTSFGFAVGTIGVLISGISFGFVVGIADSVVFLGTVWAGLAPGFVGAGCACCGAANFTGVCFSSFENLSSSIFNFSLSS